MQGLPTSRIDKNSKKLQILYQMYYSCHLQLNTAMHLLEVLCAPETGGTMLKCEVQVGRFSSSVELRTLDFLEWFYVLIESLLDFLLLNWNITMTDDISAFHWLVSVKDFGAHLVIMGRGVKKMHCISSFKHLGKIKEIILIVSFLW